MRARRHRGRRWHSLGDSRKRTRPPFDGLDEAARRLAAEPHKILEIALDCGFGDVSNFNRAFRAEFGASPRAYRRQAAV